MNKSQNKPAAYNTNMTNVLTVLKY